MKSASTSLPSTIPATVAFARPAHISWATSWTERGFENVRCELSGSVTVIMVESLSIIIRGRRQAKKRKKALRFEILPGLQRLTSHEYENVLFK